MYITLWSHDRHFNIKIMQYLESTIYNAIGICCPKLFILQLDLQVFTYSRSAGTSHLQRHLKTCVASSSSRTREPTQSFIDISGRQQATPVRRKVVLTSSETASVKEAELELCSLGYQSFHSLESEGLRKFAQTFADLGAKKGYFNVSIADKTIFGRTAVQNLCLNKAAETKKNIQDALNEPKAASALATTTDIWSDSHRNMSYLDVHAFWISEEFVVKHCLLSVDHFGEEPHTGDNILLRYEKVLEEYSLPKGSTPVVTDRGSNMIAGKVLVV